VPDGGGKSNLRLGKINADRLKGRTDLLHELDTMRRDIDANKQMEAMDSFTHKAVEVVTSGRMGDALDVDKEEKATLKRYVGEGTGRSNGNRNFLMARRLIEAGVGCVTLAIGGWDTHSGNFKTLRNQLPKVDRAAVSVGAESIRRTDRLTGLHATAGQNCATDRGPVVAAGFLVDARGAAELAPGDHGHIVEHTESFQVFDERAKTLIEL
jgi:hypothetical protein